MSKREVLLALATGGLSLIASPRKRWTRELTPHLDDKTYEMHCPFHASRKLTMLVNTTQGLYYCFECEASGDVCTALTELGKINLGAGWAPKTQRSDSGRGW